VEIFGASPDYPDSLAVFRQTWALPFTLLSDPDLALARRYGVIRGFLTPFVDRAMFLIDPRGRIERIAPGVDPLGSPDVIRGWLAPPVGG
jgi:peroxiredoxin